MGLLVSLEWGETQLRVGSHEAVILAFDELRSVDGDTLAGHRRNRWITESGDEFPTLKIAGPLIVTHPTDANVRLGPYQNLSTFDGVAYVEGRVFAFTDLQNGDWYVHDAGVHWPAIRVAFHQTGP